MRKLLFLLRKPQYIFISLILKIPYFSFLKETNGYGNSVNFAFWFLQKILNFGGNKQAYWPVHWSSQVYDSENILIGVGTYPGIMKSCYIQGRGGISFGDYTLVAPNVIIVSANHNVYDKREYVLASVKIGNYCWIGADAKIMPGVELGDFTVVAAGAVVTKSFVDGYCILSGIPATEIKKLERNKCIQYKNSPEYIGYIKKNRFELYKLKHLKVKDSLFDLQKN
jgi:acetyltransferase-like isoleucine patch superfamily enzyme